MPILKQDRNSTHHGGIGFPRIIVLAASLDQNNGTIATKKCKRLLSPRHGTVQTLRHVMFHVFSYGHLHVLQVLPLRMFSWTVKRPFQVRTAWSFMDKGVKISTSTLVSVTKGPPESLFTMQIKFPGSPCRALWAPRKRRQRCHQVIRLSGWMFCHSFPFGKYAWGFNQLPLVAIQNRNKTRVVHRCEPNDSRIHLSLSGVKTRHG